MTYAIVDIETEIIVNAIEWDGETPFEPPAGTALIPMPEGSWIGDTAELQS